MLLPENNRQKFRKTVCRGVTAVTSNLDAQSFAAPVVQPGPSGVDICREKIEERGRKPGSKYAAAK